MSEKKFTSGPWIIDRRIKTAVNCGFKHVAMVGCYQSKDVRTNIGEEEHEANVHLIAAAPDMYEALETTLENIRSLGPAGALYDTYKPWEELVESALRKARGEE